MTTCYLCENVATSKEHVPPRCVFPGDKLSPEAFRFRKNLIKVPSCDLHNSAKSNDDEYLRFLLTTAIFEDAHKDRIFETKVMRAIDRKPHVYKQFVGDMQPVLVKDQDGKSFETAAYTADLKRFDSSIHHIACGLYYFHTAKKWLGKSRIITNALMDLSERAVEINEANQNLCKKISFGFSNIEFQGDNPEIFKYKIYSNSTGQHGVFMVFYGAIEITAVLF